MQDGPSSDQSQEGNSSIERRRSRSDSLREDAKKSFQAQDTISLKLKEILRFRDGDGSPSPDSPTITSYKDAKKLLLIQFANDQEKQRRALLELKAEHLGKPLPAGWETLYTIEEMKQKLRVITQRNVRVSDVAVQSQDSAIDEKAVCKPS